MPINTKAGYVYLFQAGDTCRFKIGCSKNPENRLKDIMRSGSPYPITLIGKKKCTDMYKTEKQWHKLFESTREFGEWFDLTYDQLARLCKKLKVDIGIHMSKRTKDELIVGNKYYISWDSIQVVEVELLAFEYDSVLVKATKGHEQWHLYEDEVRKTPIGALFNRVTM